MFDFRGLWSAIKRHPGAFGIVLIVAVVFFGGPILLVWSYAKRVPVVGGALAAAERANPLK